MVARSLWLERLDVAPGTVNDLITQQAYHARKREIREWRAWAKEAVAGQDPIVGPVTIHVTPLRRTNARIDPGAPFFAVKGAIDGIVDAGRIPDDSTRYVRQLVFESPDVGGRTGLRIVVRAVEEHTTQDQPSLLALENT